MVKRVVPVRVVTSGQAEEICCQPQFVGVTGSKKFDTIFTPEPGMESSLTLNRNTSERTLWVR